MNTLIKFFGKKNVFLAIILSLLASAVSLFSFVYPMLFRSIVESLESYRILDYRTMGIYLGLLLLGIILQYVGTISFTKFKLNLQYSFRAAVLANFLTLSDREKKQRGIGAFQNRISAELGYAFTILNVTTFKSVILLARLVFALYIGFLWSVQIGIVFAVNVSMYAIAAFIMNRRMAPIYKDISDAEPKFSAFLVEFLNGITTILNRKAAWFYLGKNKRLNDRIKDLYFKETVNSETISLVFIDIVNVASTILILAISIRLYIRDEFTFGLIVAVLEYFRFIVDPIDIYNRIYQQFLRSRHFAAMLLPIIETERKTNREEAVCREFKAADKIIEAKNLTCTLGDSLLIDDVSFDVVKNDRIAIVGQSGEGKSVILDILLKNITEYSGTVKFMGEEIKELERADVLGSIGYYSQDIHIFNDDIYSNVRDGENAALVDGLLESFGLSGLKGRELGENGINISKGEKSRVEMLRLILGNRSLVLLDEPLDGLDNLTKEKILARLSEFLQDKTAIVISHDFDILEKIATKYIFISNDKKLHVGTSEELCRTNLAYKALFDGARKAKEDGGCQCSGIFK